MSSAESVRRRPARFRLAVELLEDRTLLSAALPPQLTDASSTDYDPTTILVRFRPEARGAVRGDEIMAGSVVGRAVAELLVPGLYTVQLSAGVSVPQALAAYKASPLVEYAEPNFHLYTTDTIPNDPRWPLPGMQRIRAPLAWDYWVGSGATIVADIDTGIDYNHPDLRDNTWPGIGYNFLNNTPNPLDDNGHGSHTAGTMAAVGNNGIGVVGVNWYAQIMALKFLNAAGSGSLDNAVRALNFAVANGAAVSNNSYGCLGCFSQSFLNALQTADAYGHVFVAAAGNNGRNIDSSPFYPASYGTSVGNVISVAATYATNDLRASFSNYGPNSVHVAAPGVNIVSTYRNGGYATSSGTSMASPHVAGAVALMLDYWGPWGTPADYRNWVMATADYAGLPVMSGGRLNVAALIGAGRAPGGGAGGGRIVDPVLGDPLVVRPLTPGLATALASDLATVPAAPRQAAPVEPLRLLAAEPAAVGLLAPTQAPVHEELFTWAAHDLWSW